MNTHDDLEDIMTRKKMVKNVCKKVGKLKNILYIEIHRCSNEFNHFSIF